MNDSVRDYSMTDAELMMYASNLVTFITRDSVQFEDYGVDAAAITAFETLGNQFEVFPPDLYYQADLSVATQTKDNSRSTLILETRKITNRALMKWGENSPEYKKFGVKGISNMTDKQLLATSRLVVHTAGEYLSALASDGLTQAMIDDYEDVTEQFEVDLNAVSTAIAVRDKKREERVTLGNRLYSYVTKYCTFGKTIWDKVDAAYYDDYIIYTEKSPGSLTAPENLQYDQITGRISWQSVLNATSYKVEISFEAGEFEEVYADVETETYYIPPSSPSNFIIHAMARNSGGLGPFSPLTVEYDPPLQPPGYMSLTVTNPTLHTIAINWGDSVGANAYRLFHSAVALSAPQGEFTLVGEYANTSYNGTVNAASRNYFYVVAVKGEETSAPSDVGYIDML